MAALRFLVKRGLIYPLHWHVVSRTSRINCNIPVMAGILISGKFNVGGHIEVTVEVSVPAASVNEDVADVKEPALLVSVTVVTAKELDASVKLEAAYVKEYAPTV